MTNIPFITTLFIIFVSVNSFKIIRRDESPDLPDENENLVEPKMNFWNTFLKTKARSSFKNILKYLNSFDSRHKYTVPENEVAVIDNQSYDTQPGLTEIKDFNSNNKFKKVDNAVVVQDTGSKQIITDTKLEDAVEKKDFDDVNLESENESNDGSESIESSHHIIINLEENASASPNNATSDKNIDSSDNGEISESIEHKTRDNSESKESKSSEESPTNMKSENTQYVQLTHGASYRPRLPSSLHNSEFSRRKYIHSFRHGWIY